MALYSQWSVLGKLHGALVRSVQAYRRNSRPKSKDLGGLRERGDEYSWVFFTRAMV